MLNVPCGPLLLSWRQGSGPGVTSCSAITSVCGNTEHLGSVQVLENRIFSEGLHVLGQPPAPDQAAQYLSAYFGTSGMAVLCMDRDQPVCDSESDAGICGSCNSADSSRAPSPGNMQCRSWPARNAPFYWHEVVACGLDTTRVKHSWDSLCPAGDKLSDEAVQTVTQAAPQDSLADVRARLERLYRQQPTAASSGGNGAGAL